MSWRYPVMALLYGGGQKGREVTLMLEEKWRRRKRTTRYRAAAREAMQEDWSSHPLPPPCLAACYQPPYAPLKAGAEEEGSIGGGT